jgi:hypothetical protein
MKLLLDRRMELQDYCNLRRLQVKLFKGVICVDVCTKVANKLLECFNDTELDLSPHVNDPFVDWLQESVVETRNWLFGARSDIQPTPEAIASLHPGVIRVRAAAAGDSLLRKGTLYTETKTPIFWLEAAAGIILYISSAVDGYLFAGFGAFQSVYDEVTIKNGSKVLFHLSDKQEPMTLFFICNLIRIAHLFIPEHKGRSQ